jgi:hypothetical protein
MSKQNFIDRVRGNSPNLFYDQLGSQGLPYFGEPELLTQDETQELRSTATCFNGVFNTANEEQNSQYLRIKNLDANGLGKIIHLDRKEVEGSLWPTVYVEWVEYYLENI